MAQVPSLLRYPEQDPEPNRVTTLAAVAGTMLVAVEKAATFPSTGPPEEVTVPTPAPQSVEVALSKPAVSCTQKGPPLIPVSVTLGTEIIPLPSNAALALPMMTVAPVKYDR